ncbi:hypothetical protein QG37_06717 [Candidozyma auris]|nr:hypothetical protein QG37_06717 [[Candida] auris]
MESSVFEDVSGMIGTGSEKVLCDWSTGSKGSFGIFKFAVAGVSRGLLSMASDGLWDLSKRFLMLYGVSLE